MNLLMISGKGATETALGKQGAFYSTLEELRKYFDRIDVIAPGILNNKLQILNEFSNVFFHSNVPDQKFDVMTVHEYAPFRNGRIANKIWRATGVPMMFEIMHIPGVPRSGGWRELAAKIMMGAYIKHDTRHARIVRVINSQTGAWLVKAGVPAEKIKLIPAFYIDLDVFKPLEIEKKYDLIFVGRRATNKGIELFEEAVQMLDATGYTVRALIVDGWAKDADEVAGLLNQSKLLVMPSYNEGGPRVVLEALACGVPVLATNVGIVPDVLPKDRIIDWSADDIVRKARPILERGIGMGEQRELIETATRFEKRAGVKRYAEAIKSLV